MRLVSAGAAFAVIFVGAFLGAFLGATSANAQTPAGDAEEATEEESKDSKPKEAGSLGGYFDEIERLGLLSIETGTQKTLAGDVRAAEELLSSGATGAAAVALFTIVESPRYRDLDEFVEYHNAEYYLGVALARSGAYDSALTFLARAIARGPGSLYFAPAHRRAIDIAIDTRAYDQVLEILDDINLAEPLGPGPLGERSYLKARIVYGRGDFKAAEGELARISRKSRLYSSALYLRGIINTRTGQFKDAAGALCEIADTPDSNRFTFVVDDRYFRIKDLARLGLGRLAHEVAEYDGAYYHYFQVPDDSDRLPEALFEASWSMYQKRELSTARDLASEFAKTFPTSPLWPEAQLLAGYVELADCEFDAAQKHYDGLVEDLEPVLSALNRIRKSPEERDALFARALSKRRAERADPNNRLKDEAKNVSDRVLGLLSIDPTYVRLHESMTGLRGAEGQAKLAIRAWSRLGAALSKRDVAAVAKDEETSEAAQIAELAEDIRVLGDQLGRARAELRRAEREGTISADDADTEKQRLTVLASEIATLEDDAQAASSAADETQADEAPAGLKPMVQHDLGVARGLEGEADKLLAELEGEADRIAQQAIERLYTDTRRVYDKAKLGKIDAVIGQKRRLEIEVQDLAAGRFPPELFGSLWEKGLIGDDEELWPFEGEYWADEYEGFR